MRFSVHSDGKGYRLTVTDGEGEVLSVPTETLTEAHALQRKAVTEGVDSIEVPKPKATAKIAAKLKGTRK